MKIGNKAGSNRLKIWMRFLYKVLGWSAASSTSWASRYHEDLADENSLLFHESDFWDPLHEVISYKLRLSKRPSEIRRLVGDMDWELCNLQEQYSRNLTDEFWNEAICEINRTLLENGSSLNEVLEEKGYKTE